MRDVAVLMARLRAGAGLVELLAPGVWIRLLLPPSVRGPGVATAIRLKGARDLALGLGALLAARHGDGLRGWTEAGALTDLLDAVVIGADPDDAVSAVLRRVGAAAGVGVAVVTAVAARRLAAGATRVSAWEV